MHGPPHAAIHAGFTHEDFSQQTEYKRVLGQCRVRLDPEDAFGNCKKLPASEAPHDFQRAGAAQHVNCRKALRQKLAMAAVAAEDMVLWSEGMGRARRCRLLPDGQMRRAFIAMIHPLPRTLRFEGRQHLFEPALEAHVAQHRPQSACAQSVTFCFQWRGVDMDGDFRKIQPTRAVSAGGIYVKFAGHCTLVFIFREILMDLRYCQNESTYVKSMDQMSGGAMIVCCGENLIDMIETPDTQGARRFTAHVGGSPYNCSRAVARLGHAAGYLGTLSTDSFGDQLLGTLTEDGVRHLGERASAPTTLAVVTVEDGTPDYRFYRDGTAERQITAEGLRACLPDETQAVHLGSIALVEGSDADAWQAMFQDAAQAGLFTSLDPNVRALIADANSELYRARLESMAAQAALIKLSDEDAAWWFSGLAPEAALRRLAALAPQAVLVLTQGPGEVLCRWAGGSFACPSAQPGTLADTVGAGDTLMAAMLVGLARIGTLSPSGLRSLDGDQLKHLIGDATRAAAITCSRTGCNPPTAQDLWGMP